MTEIRGPAGRFIARTNMMKDAARIFTSTCEGFTSAWSTVSAAARGGDEAEIRALVVESPAMTLLIALAGPARSMSADWWAINKRAFEIVLASLYTV